MYALATAQGAFLFPTKEECIEVHKNPYIKHNMFGWLFWTDETFDLLLKTDCRMIIDKTLKEVSAKEFIEAYKSIKEPSE